MNYPPPIPPIAPTYKETSHILHLVLTLITCGLWALVWPLVHLVNVMNNKSKREHYEQRLNEYHHYTWTQQQQNPR